MGEPEPSRTRTCTVCGRSYEGPASGKVSASEDVCAACGLAGTEPGLPPESDSSSSRSSEPARADGLEETMAAPAPPPRDESTIDTSSFRAPGGTAEMAAAPSPRATSASKNAGILDWDDDDDEDEGAIEAGSTLGNYEVLGQIGRGGMGIVYKARQKGLDRIVALKVLQGGVATEEDLARFQREARAVAKLRHPNIVPVYEVGRSRGRDFFTMDYVEGETLHQAVVRERPALRDSLEIVRKVALAVDYAHRKGIIHRDLKPSNILLTADREPLVMDFGLAKDTKSTEETLTEKGIAMGSPPYMPPEQAQGDFKRVDRISDVYALGATLYECLTGAPPFTGRTVYEVIQKVLDEEPKPPTHLDPSVPREVEWIVLKALEKNRHRRYPSAEELAKDIQRHLDGEPVRARPITLTTRIEKFVLRRKRELLAAALTGIVVLGLLWFVVSAVTGMASPPTPARPETASLPPDVAVEGPLAELVAGLEGEPRQGWERLPQLAAVLDAIPPSGASPWPGAAKALERWLAETDVGAGARRHAGAAIEEAGGADAVGDARPLLEALDRVVRRHDDPARAAALVADGARAVAFAAIGARGYAPGARSAAAARLVAHYLLGAHAERLRDRHRGVEGEDAALAVLSAALAQRPLSASSVFLARDALYLLERDRGVARAEALAQVAVIAGGEPGRRLAAALARPVVVEARPRGIEAIAAVGPFEADVPGDGLPMWDRRWPGDGRLGAAAPGADDPDEAADGAPPRLRVARRAVWSADRSTVFVVGGLDVLVLDARSGAVLARHTAAGPIRSARPRPGGGLALVLAIAPESVPLADAAGVVPAPVTAVVAVDASGRRGAGPAIASRARASWLRDEAFARRDVAVASAPTVPAAWAWLAARPESSADAPNAIGEAVDALGAAVVARGTAGEAGATRAFEAALRHPELDPQAVLDVGLAADALGADAGLGGLGPFADRAYGAALRRWVTAFGLCPELAGLGPSSPGARLAAVVERNERRARDLERRDRPERAMQLRTRDAEIVAWRRLFGGVVAAADEGEGEAAGGVRGALPGEDGFARLGSADLYAGDLLARLCFQWGLIFLFLFAIPAVFLRYRRMQRADLARIGIRSVWLEIRTLARSPSLRLRHLLLAYVSRGEKAALLLGIVIFFGVLAVQDAMLETVRVRLAAPGELFEASPGHPAALGWLEERLAERAEARTRAGHADPDAAAIESFVLAHARASAGRHAEAGPLFESLVQTDPRALVNLAVAAHARGDARRARELLEEATARAPDDVLARWNLALVVGDVDAQARAAADLPGFHAYLDGESPRLAPPTRGERDAAVLGAPAWWSLIPRRFGQLLLGADAKTMIAFIHTLYRRGDPARIEELENEGLSAPDRATLAVHGSSRTALALIAAALLIAIALPTRPQPARPVPRGAGYVVLRLVVPGVRRFMDGPIAFGALLLITWAFLFHHMQGLGRSETFRYLGMLTEAIASAWSGGHGAAVGWPVWSWPGLREPFLAAFVAGILATYLINALDVAWSVRRARRAEAARTEAGPTGMASAPPLAPASDDAPPGSDDAARASQR